KQTQNRFKNVSVVVRFVRSPPLPKAGKDGAPACRDVAKTNKKGGNKPPFQETNNGKPVLMTGYRSSLTDFVSCGASCRGDASCGVAGLGSWAERRWVCWCLAAVWSASARRLRCWKPR